MDKICGPVFPTAAWLMPTRNLWSAWPKQSAGIFEHQGEVERMSGQRFKIVSLVKHFGRLVLGVNQQRANADGFGRCERAQDGVFQQSLSHSLPLFGAVHRKASEQHHGNRVTRCTLLQSRRCIRKDDLSRSEAVIRDHDVAVAGRDERPRGPRLVIRERVLDEIVVQRCSAAVESRDLMMRPDGLRPV